jgi:DNA-binding CsgD family transcriptional regulator
MADQYAHIHRLTGQERAVLQRVAQGQRTAEISQHQQLKPDSVRVYLRDAMDKLPVVCWEGQPTWPESAS